MKKRLAAVLFVMMIVFVAACGKEEVRDPVSAGSAGEQEALSEAVPEADPQPETEQEPEAKPQPEESQQETAKEPVKIKTEYGTDCVIDLNGDGKKDTIQTQMKIDEYDMISEVRVDVNKGSAGVTIDNNYTGEDKAFLECPMEYYYVVDLDLSDDYREIAIGDYGMNDYNATYFYRYDGDSLIYLGYIPNVLDDTNVVLDGDGMIRGSMRIEMVETVRANVFYQLKKDKIHLVEQPWYEADYSHFPEEYLTHDVLQDVTVYTSNDLGSDTYVLKAGEEDVRFLATDNVEWVKLKTKDGQVYYLHMIRPIVIDMDGQEVFVPDVFDSILLAG